MKPLLDINSGKLASSGLFPGVAPNQPVLWETGVNVLFANDGVNKVLGVNPQGTETNTVSAFVQAFVQGERRVYVLSKNKVRKWIDGSFADLTPGGMAVSNKWSGVSWGTWLIATNNVDPPWVWKNTGVMVPLGGLSGILTHARIVKKLRNMLIFFGSANDEQVATWSNVSAPESFDPAVAGTFAGQLPLRDADSDIVAAWPLAGDMLIYTTDSCIRMEYVGLPNVWGFDPALPGIGAVSDASVIPVMRMHYGMGRDGFWQTDGVTYKYIGRPDVQTFWEATIDRTKLADVVGFHYKLRNTVVWYYPSKAGPIIGLGYNYVTGVWTILDQQVVAASDEQAYQWPIVALGASWGYFDATDSADLEGAMTASITLAGQEVGQPERLKRWDMLRVQVSDVVGDLEVRFGFSEIPVEKAAITDWTAWTPLVYENWIGRESTYLAFEIHSTVKSDTWRLGGFTLLGEVSGWRV